MLLTTPCLAPLLARLEEFLLDLTDWLKRFSEYFKGDMEHTQILASRHGFSNFRGTLCALYAAGNEGLRVKLLGAVLDAAAVKNASEVCAEFAHCVLHGSLYSSYSSMF